MSQEGTCAGSCSVSLERAEPYKLSFRTHGAGRWQEQQEQQQYKLLNVVVRRRTLRHLGGLLLFFWLMTKGFGVRADVLRQCEPLISSSKSAMEMLLQLYMIILMTPLCLPLSSFPLHSLRRYPFISHFLVFMFLPRPSHRSRSFCLPRLPGASITICVCGPHTKARFP